MVDRGGAFAKGFRKIAELEAGKIGLGVEAEWRLDRKAVGAVRAVDRGQHQPCVFDEAADRPYFVERPTERHAAGARHAAEGWSEASRAATLAWRGDRPK